MVRTTIKGHFRPGSPLHVPLWARIGQQDQSQTKPINRVPPSDRRALRAEESMGQTIPVSHRKRTTGRLESVAHGSLRST